MTRQPTHPLLAAALLSLTACGTDPGANRPDGLNGRELSAVASFQTPSSANPSARPSTQEPRCSNLNREAPSRDPQVLRVRGELFARTGQPDSALAYYTDALLSQDTTQTGSLCQLLQGAPVLRRTRTVSEERAFVRAVRSFVRMTPAGNEGALRIESADQAYAALTAMLAHQKANIEIYYVPPGLLVHFIDYLHRDDPHALWESFRSDTVIRRNATAYRFKYRLPGSNKDTIDDIPCANGCRVPR